MSVVTSDYLAGVLTTFRRGFSTEFAAASNMQPWRELVMGIDSTSDTESHNWFGTTPKMVDVTKGELQTEGLHAFTYSIQNKTWKAGIEVERATMEDDRVGQMRPALDGLAQEAARHPGELVFGLFNTNGVAFDNVAFFSDTRTLGRSANIDNILTGTGVTVAAFQTDLGVARAAMRLFQDDQGRPMNLVGNTIVIPAGLEQVVYQALNANQGTIANPVIPANADGSFSVAGYLVVVNPYLTDLTDWYLIHRNGAFRPFIFQSRIAPALEGITTLEEVWRVTAEDH